MEVMAYNRNAPACAVMESAVRKRTTGSGFVRRGVGCGGEATLPRARLTTENMLQTSGHSKSTRTGLLYRREERQEGINNVDYPRNLSGTAVHVNLSFNLNFGKFLMCARWCGLILLCLSALFAYATERKQPPASQATNITITTSRPDARTLFESGMVEFENEHINKALENWQKAIRKDPSFAVAHLFISEATYDPVERKTERRRAKALAVAVTSGEKLLIKWMTGVQE